jgi:hypothetical protein
MIQSKPYYIAVWLFFIFLSGAVTALAQPSVSFDTARQHIKMIIAQLPDSSDITIESIIFAGNKKTKNHIIQREVPFKAGSKINSSLLEETIAQARTNIVNTQLFLEVVPRIVKTGDQQITVYFTVKERWYLFPVPYIKPIDRNLMQWLLEQNLSLERVNYGLKFNWYNVSGRRDKMSFNFINGYARQYSFFYEQPYADKKLEKGFLFGASYTQGRQVSYATDSNKQVFYPVNNSLINDFVRTSFRAEAGLSVRKGIYQRHVVRVVYAAENISDTIQKLITRNEQKGYLPFFTGNKTSQRYGEISYNYQYLNLNNNAYPWKGFAFNGYFLQRGLGAKGMNLWQFGAKATRFFELDKKTSISLVGHGLLKLPFQQPGYNMGALGYGDWYLQGLELYVIDGVMAGILKGTVRREFLNFRVPTFIIKSEKYKKIPFKIVAKAYANIGGAHMPYYTNSFLNNKLLRTAGFGIDILTYYDFIGRIDYSFNQLKQKGIYVSVKREF